MADPHHAPKKHFGQHFLHDTAIIERIVRAIDPRPGDRLVEIGPGQGALTLPLLRRHGALQVVELDRDLIEPLRALDGREGALEVIHSDVLKVDFGRLAGDGVLRLVGNLPYNISTPILFHCLDHSAAIHDMHFMLQKEVVDRMAAPPGGKTYGRLSVMLQLRCSVEPLLHVPPGAFRPPPKVESAVVRLVPLPKQALPDVDAKLLGSIVRAAFGQRRKTISNAVSEFATAANLVDADIDPRARAEQLAPQAFVNLAKVVSAR